MTFNHAVVWIDHQRAQIIKFNPDQSELTQIHPHGGDRHLHHKRGSVGPGHAPENQAYYESVATALKGIGEVLVTGPASAKNELVKHIQAHNHALAKAIVGVESSDHPSAGEILAHARKWFERADRMRAGSGMKLP
jgi:stalled ribosome rescue protein Dom34